MRTLTTAAILSALALSPAAEPYDPPTTHVALFTRSLELAAPGGYEELQAYKDVIKIGVVNEDDGEPILRFVNHFFDPDTGFGMPKNSYTILYEGRAPSFSDVTRYMSAYEWGLHGMPDHFDWESGIDAYGYWANHPAYRALGHVLHLLQDMAQPDHAKCRPHPGGYAHDMIAGEASAWRNGVRKQIAEVLFPENRIGYEALWRYKNAEWPRGQVVKRVRNLKDVFSTLGDEAKRAENVSQLLDTLAGEKALGLRSYRSGRADPGGMRREALGEVVTIALDALMTVWRLEQYSDFGDNLWLDFELNVPIVPMIPWPPDATTKKYIELGNIILPVAEERGAGLLQHFYDIVNHPPIVEAVEIRQGGEPRYKKHWNPRAADRELISEADVGIELGQEAEIRITFGPNRVQPKLLEPIVDIKVFLEFEGGELLPIKGQVVSGTGEAVTWAGSLVPQKYGTLRIEARDGHAHFEERNHKGDVLDSQPATYALARSPAPYNWIGYEPGPDRTHRLAASTACGVCAAVGRHEKTFVSGTYKGTISRNRVLRDGGLEDTQADLTFRCLRVAYPWDRAEQKNDLIIGHGTGTYTLKIRHDARKPVETFTGGPIWGGGSIQLNQPCTGQGHAYTLNIAFPDAKYGQLSFYTQQVARSGLSLSGDIVDESKAHLIWNVVFAPAPEPPHFAAAGNLNPGMIGSFLSDYTKQVWAALTPGHTRLAVAGRSADVKRVDERMQEPYTALSQSGEAESRLHRDVIDRYRDAERAWIELDPKEKPDEKYRAAVPALAESVSRWKAFKKSTEDRFVAATLDVARLVEPVDKDGAKKLRDLAEKLKTQGSESFGDTGR